jgi:hypothetical protein
MEKSMAKQIKSKSSTLTNPVNHNVVGILYWIMISVIGVYVFINAVTAYLYYQDSYLMLHLVGGKEQLNAHLSYDQNSLRTILIGNMLITILTMLSILIWISASNHFSLKKGATDMKYSPMDSILCYFMPITQFWKPREAIIEIYKATYSPKRWQLNAYPHNLIDTWWALFICSVISILYGQIKLVEASDVEKYEQAREFSVAIQFVEIMSAIIFMVIASKIYQYQKKPAPSIY